jgi:hypothetical protein
MSSTLYVSEKRSQHQYYRLVYLKAWRKIASGFVNTNLSFVSSEMLIAVFSVNTLSILT